MKAPENPTNPSDRIKQEWANVDRLLPPDYKESYQPGWVELFVDHSNLFIRHPRQRGNYWTNALSRALGKPVEGVRTQHRWASIGTLNEWPTVTDSRPEQVAPPKLTIGDNIYTPINPVDGNANPIRNTWVLFRHSSSINSEYLLYEDGLLFNFWETIDENGKPKQQLKVRHHTSVHPYYAPPDNTDIDHWLVANGLPKPYSQESQAIAVETLEFCISEARKSE